MRACQITCYFLLLVSRVEQKQQWQSVDSWLDQLSPSLNDGRVKPNGLKDG